MDLDFYEKAYVAFSASRKGDPSNLPPTLDFEKYRFAETHVQDIFRGFYRHYALWYTREILNELHRLIAFVRDVRAWLPVLREYSESERFQLITEFIDDRASLALSRPYAIRNRFIYSATMLGVVARRPKAVREVPKERTIEFKVMRKVISDWEGWPSFIAALEGMDSEKFRFATNHYRDRDAHRMPSHFEIGLSPALQIIEQDEKPAYTMGHGQPMELQEVANLLEQEYLVGCATVDPFWKMIESREAKW